MRKIMVCCGVITLFFAVMVLPIMAQDQVQPDQAQGDRVEKIIVRVDGLSCPFCVFGLEKRLKNMEGSEKVTIFIKRGVAEILVAPGKSLSEEKVRQTVLDAGFTPREIQIVRGE